MRQRKLKDLDERLEMFGRYRIDSPWKFKGEWDRFFMERGAGMNADTYLEIGCGKGRFLMSHAEAERSSNFIGVECQQSVLVRALEKACDGDLRNVIFVDDKVYDVRDYFEEGELAGIYLNFSDPWPKARHAKRRLTHRDYLKSYCDVVRDGGTIEFKTDNDDLFGFTLEEIKVLDLQIEEFAVDLHGSNFESKKFMTEYEEKFSSRGKTINYLRIRNQKEQGK